MKIINRYPNNDREVEDVILQLMIKQYSFISSTMAVDKNNYYQIFLIENHFGELSALPEEFVFFFIKKGKSNI